MAAIGFIKLHRSILDWEWFSVPATRLVFEYLLLAANYEDRKWKGISVQRGQIITSYPALANINGISIQSVRTAINHLKSTNEITVLSTKTYTLITVLNYEKYQSKDEVSNKGDSADSNGQPTDDQRTANNDLRNKEYIRTKKIDDYDYMKKGGCAPTREKPDPIEPITLDGFGIQWRSKAEQLFFDTYCKLPNGQFADECFPAFLNLFLLFDDRIVYEAVKRSLGRANSNPLEYVRSTCGQIKAEEQAKRKSNGGKPK